MAAAREGVEEPSNVIVDAACAIELLHLGSLTHDDVIDGGMLRRGQPSVAAVAGDRIASAAGAMVVARSVEIICGCGSEALSVFTQTATDMCEGGMLELRSAADSYRTEENYLRTASLKTAAALGSACRLGATLAGCEQTVVLSVERFGHDLGMAWQIWDDLLDIRDKSGAGGKSTGRDLANGVFTLPTIFAVESSNELGELLQSGSLSEVQIQRCVGLIKGTTAIERCSRRADDFFRAATDAVASLQFSRLLLSVSDEIRAQHRPFTK